MSHMELSESTVQRAYKALCDRLNLWQEPDAAVDPVGYRADYLAYAECAQTLGIAPVPSKY